MALTPQQAEQLAILKLQFEKEWGGFRRYISANPLTGFWIGVGFGAAATYGLVLVLGYAFS